MRFCTLGQNERNEGNEDAAMFTDFDFYTNVFKGTALTEDEWAKFGNEACIYYITANTLSRITDTEILLYSIEIQERAKTCAYTNDNVNDGKHIKNIDNLYQTISKDDCVISAEIECNHDEIMECIDEVFSEIEDELDDSELQWKEKFKLSENKIIINRTISNGKNTHALYLANCLKIFQI